MATTQRVGAIALVMAWIVGLTVVGVNAVGFGSQRPATAASSYLPDDGDALRVQWRFPAITTLATIEHTRSTGLVADRVHGADATASRIWRDLATVWESLETDAPPVDDRESWWREAVLPAQPLESRPRERLLRDTPRGVELWAWRQPGTLVLTPAPRLLPADPTPGTRWEDRGQLSQVIDDAVVSAEFVFTGTVVGAPDIDNPDDVALGVPNNLTRDCLVVETALTAALTPRRSLIQTRSLWCPNRGVVAEVGTYGNAPFVLTTGSGEYRSLYAPDRPPPYLFGVGLRMPVRFGLPADMAERASSEIDLRASSFPVAAENGQLYYLTGNELRGTVFDLNAQVHRPDWTAHPGGTPLTLTAYGPTLLVTTSQRALVAYAAGRTRVWTAVLPEIVTQPPVPIGADRIAALAVDGTLSVFSLRDGTPLWRTIVPGATRIVSDGRILVADEVGRMVVFSADGVELGRVQGRPAAPRGITLAGGRTVAWGDTWIEVSELTGRRTWLADGEAVRDVVTIAGPNGAVLVVVAYGDRTVGYDSGTGQPVWRLPAARSLMGLDQGLVLLLPTGVLVASADGRVVTTMESPVLAETLASDAEVRLQIAGPELWVLARESDGRLGGFVHRRYP